MATTTTTTVRTRINPAALIWVRKTGGYSIDDFANRADVTTERMQNWENGSERPTYSQLKKLAVSVKRPIAVFYLQRLPVEPAAPQDMRRIAGAGSGYSADLLVEIRKARYMAGRIADLRNAANIPAPNVPRYSVLDDPERCAKEFREILSLTIEEQHKSRDGADMLNIWRDRLYEIGIVSLIYSLKNETALGFALWEEGVPMACVNSSRGPQSGAFTLFHEVGHLCLRSSAVSNAGDDAPVEDENELSEQDRLETFCNLFSAAILLPADAAVLSSMQALKQENRWDSATGKRIAGHFRVSKYVFLRRMLTLDLIQRNDFFNTQRKWQEEDSHVTGNQIAKSTGGPTFYITTVSHLGRRYSADVLEATLSNRITNRDASDLLGIKQRQVGNLADEVFSPRRRSE